MIEHNPKPADPNEDFCRKLCEEFHLDMNYHGVYPAAMSAISKAIQIVMEKAAKVCEAKGRNTHVGCIVGNFVPQGATCHLADAASIRSLQLSAEDVRTEGK